MKEEIVFPEPNDVPFFMRLRSPLTNRTAVIIKGYVLENASTFSVKFCTPIKCCFCRNTNGRDAAFSLRPYFDRRYIVRNSTQKLKWQQEETAGCQDFPLIRASNFSIEIFIVDRDLLIAINGIHYCMFTLKTTLSSITSIEIDGDIKINSVDINPDQDVYPSISASKVQQSTNIGHIINVDSDMISCRDLKLPVVCVLSKTLESGNVIKIEGKAKLLPYSFLINLQNSELKWPHPNILLHINARYSYSQKKNKKNLLVFNSWLNDAWGIEKTQTDGCLPMPGSVFEIIITCKEDHFSVDLQKEVTLDFPYRSSLQGVKVIYIQGDICVYSVTFL